MPPFDLELTDPTPAAVEQAMADAVKAANGKARVGLLVADVADYKRFLAKEFAAPEGVVMWLSDTGRVTAYPPTPRGTLLGVVWRTTPLGRTVRVAGRRIEPFQEQPTHRFGPPYRPVPPLCLLDPDHVVLRTFPGGEAEMIAVCNCGVVGPPDKLAWEAEGMCGPCHDHLAEHGTPLPGVGPPALRAGGPLRNVGFLGGGRAVAAYEWIAGPYGHYEPKRTVAIWERQTGEARTEAPGKERKVRVTAAELAAGALLLCEPPLWVPEDGPSAWLAAPRNARSVTLHGTTAVVLGYGGQAWRRDLAGRGDWAECWPERPTDEAMYFSLAISPDGTKAALGREEGGVELVAWPGGGDSVTLRAPPKPDEDRTARRTHAVAFSPDGRLLAVAAGLSGFVEDPSRDWFGWGGALYLYDAVKGAFLAGFDRPTDDVLTVAFSPDGSHLAWGATDCQVRLVETKTLREVAVLSGHVGCVNAVAFSADGQTLASAGGDGLVRLWPWRQLLEREAPPKKRKKR